MVVQTDRTIRIGTRGSLLALTQAGQVKEQLERETGHSFELVPIVTEGDQKTDVPLWQLEGDNFFTKELDSALIEKRVDFVIHSYKDLGSVRPNELTIAAIPKRQLPHDILLIKKERVKQIKQGDISKAVIGTSSPRRIANVNSSLKNYLPNGENLIIETETLRGNVNTRIEKLLDDKYDAIILALAGLERLALNQKTCEILKKLLNELDFMIMPKSVFPGAASQGALALECLKENQQILNILTCIDDKIAREETVRERKAFNSYGGGCHLAVGINVKYQKGHFIHQHTGELEGKQVYKRELERVGPELLGPYFKSGNIIDKIAITKGTPINNSDFYVTNHTSIEMLKSIYVDGKVWCAGAKSMMKAVKAGFWVNGSADSLGDEEISSLLNSKALNLMMDKNKFYVLTNDVSSSKLGDTIATYNREIITEEISNSRDEILACNTFYWKSYFQYETYCKHYPEIVDRVHCSGIGKTYDTFIANEINVIPFADFDEFKRIIKDEKSN